MVLLISLETSNRVQCTRKDSLRASYALTRFLLILGRTYSASPKSLFTSPGHRLATDGRNDVNKAALEEPSLVLAFNETLTIQRQNRKSRENNLDS